MDLLQFFAWLNNDILALPATILFFGIGIVLTVKYGFLQIRAFPLFIKLLAKGATKGKHQAGEGQMRTIGSIGALFTAMATTIGIGNIVSPTLAIMVGGPGALFWLIVYIFIGSAIKFTEVVFALDTRIKTVDGHIIGGPMRYLAQVQPWLAVWYGLAMALLMAGWSGVQANTLASILAHEHVPAWVTGLGLGLFVWVVLRGGAQRVSAVASKLVPIMFIGYVSFAAIILLKDLSALGQAFTLIFQGAFSPVAAAGGLVSVTLFQTMRTGVYRGIFITESGIGTSSIPHAMADVEKPTDQGILAMFSAGADAFLSLVSGLLVLVTGIWMQGEFRSTLVYEVFKMHSPVFGRWILTGSIALFALTTVMGNSFNGRQSFAALAGFRWVNAYLLFTVSLIFLGSMMRVQLVWEMMDTVLTFVAIPNLIGVVYLAFKRPNVLKV
ncbi:MAG: amino acid carrier protein [Candidatus Dependentiae bacterium]|nr:amino acid carrier protein [Candidatus Dependentiae bacterium]